MANLPYNLFLLMLLPLLAPFLLFKRLFDERYKSGWGERFGCLPDETLNALSGDRPVWFHAASVGEVIALSRVMEDFRKRFPEKKILLSTFTVTGNRMGKEKGIADTVIYLPLDYPFFVGRAVRKIDPSLLVIMETEIWPNLIGAAKKRGARVVIVNGRISDSSFGGYKKLRPLFRGAFRNIDLILARSDEDRERFITIGARPEKIVTSGNIKFDMREEQTPLPHMEDWKGKILVAGSTHPGEDEGMIALYRRLKPKHPGLKLAIAPRHPARFDAVAEYLTTEGVPFDRRSKLAGKVASDVLLLDTLGELTKVYRYASIVFMGGSLVKRGGQNMLEPALYGRPVLFGPDVDTFREAANIVIDGGGGIMVKDWDDLYSHLDRLLGNDELRRKMGEKARAAVLRNRGATEKTVEAISGLL